MNHRIERMRHISRAYVRANRDKLFLFGDNLERRGFGGQAAAMRGEPNAVGIPTKNKPSYADDAFFSDEEFELNAVAIDEAFAEVMSVLTETTRVIVMPEAGLGTGRAELAKRAPRTFAHLEARLRVLERR